MAEAIWTLSEISLGRRGQRLDAISLEVMPGVTAVIGPSGAGKTSLLSLLVGYEEPTSGDVRVRNSSDSDRSRLFLGWVPPDFGLWPHLSVRQHLETVCEVEKGKIAESSTARIDELLSCFHLGELADAGVGRLSNGERSRLSVARALACDPTVLVLDEPLVHVDPVHIDHYWLQIRRFCEERGTSLVFSTHDPNIVLREAGQVICLDGGKLAYAGSVADLYHRPPSERLSRFLGPANWFAQEEIADWISDAPEARNDVCLRPERLKLVAHETSPLVVESSRATPTTSTTRIHNQQTAQLRTIVHQTSHPELAPGTRVLLRLCAVVLLLVSIAGCQRTAAAPALPINGIRTLKLPVDGSSIPTPRSLTVAEDGELIVLDKAGRVLVYNNEGRLDRMWWMPEYEVGKPEGVCELPDGRIAVADTHYHRVVLFEPDGKVAGMFGELGEEPGQFIYPVSVTCDVAGHLYVAEYGGNDRIQKFTLAGEWVLTMGSFGTAPGEFQRPSGVIWRANDGSEGFCELTPQAAQGTLFVADAINNRVQAFADDGTFLGVVGGWAGGTNAGAPIEPQEVDLNYPYDIALGRDGHLFIVEYGAGRVTCLSASGDLLGRFGTNGRGVGEFWTPWGIAAGRDGRFFVADTGNRRIVELTP